MPRNPNNDPKKGKAEEENPKKGEKPPRGQVLLAKLNAGRTKRARSVDALQTAEHTFRKPTDENIQKWQRNPGRCDFRGIDNKGHRAGHQRARQEQEEKHPKKSKKK